jgi:hypothetical protein
MMQPSPYAARPRLWLLYVNDLARIPGRTEVNIATELPPNFFHAAPRAALMAAAALLSSVANMWA